MSDTRHVNKMDSKCKYTYIKVKQEHIDNGIEKNCSFCPVALAMSEQFNTQDVTVGGLYIIVVKDKYAILGALRDRMNLFDDGYGMTPFKIRLSEFPGIRSTAEVYDGESI